MRVQSTTGMNSIGNVVWGDSDENEIIRMAAETHGFPVEKIITDLKKGINIPVDYFGSRIKIRDFDSIAPVPPQAKKVPVLACKRCGQTGHAGRYPFSTLAGSGICDDCI